MTNARAFRFPPELILWAVRWYLQFPISYRDRSCPEAWCSWHQLVRDYERRIDVSKAMILVAMGGNLLHRNAPLNSQTGSHGPEAVSAGELRPTDGTWCEKTHRQGPDPVPDSVGASAIRGMSVDFDQADAGGYWANHVIVPCAR